MVIARLHSASRHHRTVPRVTFRAVVLGSDVARTDVVAFQQSGDAVGGDRLLAAVPTRSMAGPRAPCNFLPGSALVISCLDCRLRLVEDLSAVGEQHQRRLVIMFFIAFRQRLRSCPGRFAHSSPAMSAIASNGLQPSSSRSLSSFGTFGSASASAATFSIANRAAWRPSSAK